MNESNTVAEGTYKGHEYEVTREENPGIGYHYEFHLYIDGNEVATASRIESKGWESPWIPSLRRYAKAYIDGADSPIDLEKPNEVGL